MKPKFNVKIESIAVNHSIELSDDLFKHLLNKDSIFFKISNVKDIYKDSIEYDECFGPYIFFSCELKDTLNVSKDVLKIIKNCDRNMKRKINGKKQF